MDIITVNGSEILLGCFVNLYKKTISAYNGIIVKISNYYDAITYGLLQVMHFNDLCLLFYSPVSIISLFDISYSIELKILIKL